MNKSIIIILAAIITSLCFIQFQAVAAQMNTSVDTDPDPEQIKRDIGLLPQQSSSSSQLQTTMPSSSLNFSMKTAAEYGAEYKATQSQYSTPSTESLLAGINDALGIDPVANQKIADEKEAAQMKQWNIEAEMKANGTMPLCKEGQSPLSDYVKSGAGGATINEKGEVEPGIMKETCMEEKKKMGAILLFPIE